MRSLILGALVLVASGCKSNPYCLNCKDSGNGVIGPGDMTPPPTFDLANGNTTPDLTGSGGPCIPTNGGVEICDHVDNDCNGLIDDVNTEKLVGDPKNCGMCFHECLFPHAFGVCVGGWDMSMPKCAMGGCQPGWIDLNKDPSDGCEYQCAISNGGVEICDGVDNNCDGQVDEPFTNTWSDPQHQKPNYDKLNNNCGTCGNVCNLPGANVACQGTGPGGKGQCNFISCFNGLDSNNMHQTYRHNPAAGPIGTTGCEYHCPFPSTQINVDCNPSGACTFPAEVCNGIDDDCNFLIDDNPTDPGLNGPCPDGAPGKLCSGTQCSRGICMAGTLKCVTGGVTCQGSVGPSPELCDALDNNCDGQVDENWTATWNDAGHQMPRYDSDANNCGACSSVCALPQATNGCRLIAGATQGTCYVVTCNPGWYYVTHQDKPTGPHRCDVLITQPENSTTTMAGIGCNYMCPAGTATSPEVCNGKDDDCDGCIDNGLTPPSNICANKGVCAGQTIPVNCDPSGSGWKCDYSAVPNVSIDTMGNLTVTEKQCDNLDNNCNGPCDENFPDVLVAGGSCTNPHAARTCVAGQGICQSTGPFVCANSGGGTTYNDVEKCSATANLAAAKDELCNGKDDDCDGVIDEATDDAVFKGWHDPVVQIAVAADPLDTRCGGASPPATCAAHTVYVYAYEAGRPDATATSPGSLSTRACSNVGVLPWSSVTLAQAQAACAGIKDATGTSIGRLCTAWEWQQTCDLNAVPGAHWSMSASTTSYQTAVCNDGSQTEQRCLPGATPSQCLKTCNAGGQCTCTGNADCSPGFTCNGTICVGSGAWPTGSIGSFGAGNQCYVSFGAAGIGHDFSGNLQEWTATPVTLKSGASATAVVGPGAGQLTVNGLTSIYPSDAGAQLVLSGGAAGNTGTFTILSVNSATSVVVADPAGVTSGTAMAWSFIYNKLRGGNFTTTASGGDQCEFDFDIQKATFANTDVGFRCCSTVKP